MFHFMQNIWKLFYFLYLSGKVFFFNKPLQGMAPTSCPLSSGLLDCFPGSLPACLPVCLPVCLPACLPAYLPVCLPACLPVCLPAFLLACLHACLLALEHPRTLQNAARTHYLRKGTDERTHAQTTFPLLGLLSEPKIPQYQTFLLNHSPQNIN